MAMLWKINAFPPMGSTSFCQKDEEQLDINKLKNFLSLLISNCSLVQQEKWVKHFVLKVKRDLGSSSRKISS
jgi:hypothetical protein